MVRGEKCKVKARPHRYADYPRTWNNHPARRGFPQKKTPKGEKPPVLIYDHVTVVEVDPESVGQEEDAVE